MVPIPLTFVDTGRTIDLSLLGLVIVITSTSDRLAIIRIVFVVAFEGRALEQSLDSVLDGNERLVEVLQAVPNTTTL
jgi:hypothetical protein